jgi:hypothetical protein
MNWVITTTWGDSPFSYVYKEKTKKKKTVTHILTQ